MRMIFQNRCGTTLAADSSIDATPPIAKRPASDCRAFLSVASQVRASNSYARYGARLGLFRSTRITVRIDIVQTQGAQGGDLGDEAFCIHADIGHQAGCGQAGDRRHHRATAFLDVNLSGDRTHDTTIDTHRCTSGCRCLFGSQIDREIRYLLNRCQAFDQR